MIQLDLLESFFQLKIKVFTTQPVVDEITNPEQIRIFSRHISNGDIIIDSFSNDDFIFRLAVENPGLSLTDCSVIDLAHRKNAILLSSDNSLRKKSKMQSIVVHGVLWIVETLVSENIISKEIGLIKLRQYEKINSRSPRKELEHLIKKLDNNAFS